MLRFVQQRYDVARPDIVLVGLVDPTIEFYNSDGRGSNPTRFANSLAALATRTDLTYPAIVLVDEERMEDQFEDALKKAPGLAARLSPIGTWSRWFANRTTILVLSEHALDAGAPR